MERDEAKASEVRLTWILFIMYLFLGGASAGAYLVISCWSLVFYRPGASRGSRISFAFDALSRRCHVLILLLMAAAALCLFWDLGTPERVALLFVSPRFTFITLGTFSLSAELLVGLIIALTYLLGFAPAGSVARRVLDVLCALFACVIMTYTGAFLASMPVPFWNTAALVALFLFSSFSAGVSLVLLICWFTRGQTLLLRSLRPLQKLHVSCLVAEFLALAVFLLAAFSKPSAAGAVSALMQPEMLANAGIGALGFGLAVPFLAEVYSLAQKETRDVPAADAICLIGGFMLRYAIVTCGMN